MLDSSKLVTELRKFHDPDFAQFAGFPTTRAAARAAWASAFFVYFDGVQESLVPPPSGHPSMLALAVEGAFMAALQLESGISLPTAAADFSGAWAAGVTAVTPGGLANDAAGASYTFIAFANVAALQQQLSADLVQLYATPSAALLPRLTEVAEAFHTATKSLSASATVTPPNSPPAPGAFGVI